MEDKLSYENSQLFFKYSSSKVILTYEELNNMLNEVRQNPVKHEDCPKCKIIVEAANKIYGKTQQEHTCHCPDDPEPHVHNWLPPVNPGDDYICEKCGIEADEKKSVLYCKHTNEVPSKCPCPDDCYCKKNSCYPKDSVKCELDENKIRPVIRCELIPLDFKELRSFMTIQHGEGSVSDVAKAICSKFGTPAKDKK